MAKMRHRRCQEAAQVTSCNLARPAFPFSQASRRGLPRWAGYRAAMAPRPALPVLEPEEADGARPRMRADDGAEDRRELDLRLGAEAPHELADRSDPLRRVRVRDRDPQSGPVLRGRLEASPELVQRLLSAAHARRRCYRSVLDDE